MFAYIGPWLLPPLISSHACTHLPLLLSRSAFSLLPTATTSLSPSSPPLLSSSSLSPQFCHLTLDMVVHFMDKYIGCEGAVNVHRRVYVVCATTPLQNPTKLETHACHLIWCNNSHTCVLCVCVNGWMDGCVHAL